MKLQQNIPRTQVSLRLVLCHLIINAVVQRHRVQRGVGGEEIGGGGGLHHLEGTHDVAANPIVFTTRLSPPSRTFLTLSFTAYGSSMRVLE